MRSVLASISLFYMAASWGGYAFIINIIPIFIVKIIILNKFFKKLVILAYYRKIYIKALCLLFNFLSYRNMLYNINSIYWNLSTFF